MKHHAQPSNEHFGVAFNGHILSEVFEDELEIKSYLRQILTQDKVDFVLRELQEHNRCHVPGQNEVIWSNLKH